MTTRQIQMSKYQIEQDQDPKLSTQACKFMNDLNLRSGPSLDSSDSSESWNDREESCKSSKASSHHTLDQRTSRKQNHNLKKEDYIK